MTSEEQLKIYESVHSKLTAVTKSKAHDYAGADVLSNFKGVSQAIKALEIDPTKPEGYALLMVVLKIARLTNLLNSGKSAKNESIEDSFLDGINYFILAYCGYLEGKGELEPVKECCGKWDEMGACTCKGERPTLKARIEAALNEKPKLKPLREIRSDIKSQSAILSAMFGEDLTSVVGGIIPGEGIFYSRSNRGEVIWLSDKIAVSLRGSTPIKAISGTRLLPFFGLIRSLGYDPEL